MAVVTSGENRELTTTFGHHVATSLPGPGFRAGLRETFGRDGGIEEPYWGPSDKADQ